MIENEPENHSGQDDTAGLIERIVELALSRKAINPLLLDLSELVDFTDGFLIFTGESDIQVRAIADAVREGMKADGVQPHHVEGYGQGRWIILDFVSVVVHVFYTATRDFYRLEELWGDAPVRTFAEEADG